MAGLFPWRRLHPGRQIGAGKCGAVLRTPGIQRRGAQLPFGTPASLAGWPQDVGAVYRWVRANGAQFGGSIERLFLAGESAGACHLAAATLLTRFHAAEGPPLSGVALISGVYNARLELLARRQFGVASPDPRNEAYFGTDFERYAGMSLVELIDAAPFPLLITYAEMDLLQMQVQAGELFSRLVTRHGFSPELRVIRGHNHLTQGYAINTGDEALSDVLLEFLRKP